jgi:uncharacterized membrane protein
LVASYLAWTAFSGGSVAGCGPESDCAEVLNSRWAYWFGIPVSAIALVLYAAVLFATFRLKPATPPKAQRNAWHWLIPCAVAILAAAGWFFSLQLFVIKSFCPYCLVAHGLGTAAAVLILLHFPKGVMAGNGRETTEFLHRQFQRRVLIGIAGAGILIAGQLVHQPKTFIVQPITVSETDGPRVTTGESNYVAAALLAPKPAERLFPIYNGMFHLDLGEVPLAGTAQAPHVFVSLFDYTCHHCRLMHPRLTEVQRNLSNQVAIVSLPMPLDPECNPTVTRPIPSHTNACQYARIGLAVWRANREAFDAYNHWFFEPETPLPLESVRAYAEQLVGSNALQNALLDPWIDQQIKTDVAIYEVAYRSGRGRMPQLIVGTNVFMGTLNMDELGRMVAFQLWGQ